jgi:hypothetical protein
MSDVEPGGVERRRAPRVPVGWVGQYVIPSRPDLGWGECLVLDVSQTGLGMMLFGPWPEDTHIELEVLVHLEPNPDADPVEVRGTVRNSTPVNIGDLRVGIEFTSPDSTEPISLLGAFSPTAATPLPIRLKTRDSGSVCG